MINSLSLEFCILAEIFKFKSKMTSRRSFIKSTATGLGMTALPTEFFQSLFHPGTKGGVFSFPEVSPESQGVSSQSILNFINKANECPYEWHGFILLRHGKKIAEAYWDPFHQGGKHTLYSLSKSFTSSAIGMLVDEGKIKVSDRVIDFFPDELPDEVSENLKKMTLHHLLCMNTGHDTDTMGMMRSNEDKTWVQNFLSHPVVHVPGSHFLYNTGATYMQSAIVSKVTGQKLNEYLKPRLFDPLQISDYDWEVSPQGIDTGGYGLRLSTESIARFGQLYLQEGQWEGQQLISREWISEATRYHTSSQDNDTDWGQGYGYQFWRCKPGFYRGDGAFGQYCIVMPQYDAVLAINSESWDMGKSMQIAWETLLPGFSDSGLPENRKSLQELCSLSKKLKLHIPASQPELVAKYSGSTLSFETDENPYGITKGSLKLTPTAIEWMLDGKTMRFGYNEWIKNPASAYPLLSPDSNQKGVPFAGSATWISESSLELTLKFIEGIHSDKVMITLDQSRITMKPTNSVSLAQKAEDKRAAITGSVRA